MTVQPTAAFGEYELDERLYELRRRGAIVKIEPKVFDVLAYLVRHRDRVVPKEELLGKLWPGEFVSDSVLPRCVTAARKAVGDDANRQRVIQTVHGRGYRFVAALAESAAVDRRLGADRSCGPEGGGARPSAVFVGREDALASLETAFADAVGGRGRLVLLVGEPGIGKTRTAEEFARRAIEAGASVLTGRCYEGEGAPAFWPWTQVVRACVGAGSSERETAADLAELLPDFREGVAADALPAEQARFRLFESVTAVLKGAARAQPLLVILDDLHHGRQGVAPLARLSRARAARRSHAGDRHVSRRRGRAPPPARGRARRSGARARLRARSAARARRRRRRPLHRGDRGGVPRPRR